MNQTNHVITDRACINTTILKGWMAEMAVILRVWLSQMKETHMVCSLQLHHKD